jgi:hypothetical protein
MDLNAGTVYGDCVVDNVYGCGLCLFDLNDGQLRARLPDVRGVPLAVGDALVMVGGRYVAAFGWS